MDKHIYDIWLQRILNVRSSHIKALMALFGSSEAIYGADEQSLRVSGVMSRAELQRAADKNLDEAQQIYRLSRDNGIDILSYTDETYPAILRQIPDPPFVLYIKGTLPPLTGLKTAVVGTRRTTAYGRQAAFEYAYELTRHKALIISGGADGIDTQAHHGALQAGGMTVCVLGCGILYRYGNASLQKEISQHGALISEYPPDSAIQRYTFINRNRIISGLSDCTLVIEAGANSGALVTAAFAAAHNKPIFAIPGSPDSSQAVGTNNLLRLGAVMTLHYTDLLNWYDSGLMTAQEIGQRMSEKEINQARSMTEPIPLLYLNRAENRPIVAANITDLAEDTLSAAVLPDEQMAPNEAENVQQAYQTKPVMSDQAVSLPDSSFVSAPVMVPEPPVMADKTDKTKKKTVSSQKKSDSLLTEGALSVYDTISESPTDAETIRQTLGMKIDDVLSALTELELFGFIKPAAFGQYVRT